MDARAPAVVAIVVTRDPGPFFEEALSALAAQDYEELSVLVLVSGGEENPTERVGRVLPEAFVRRLDVDRGFGAAVNEALDMVEGAAYFLVCHDDCAPDPDAVHVLVEEAYRSNAGVVSPKYLRWDDPSVLLHVGMSADKTGAVVDRVQVGEVDHGQHDAVRDMFVVPGGMTLVRADLLRELGGFDDGIVAMGEDLDLCWRAQVAGARVVVAPDARVRHLERVASGLRAVAVPDGGDPPTLQALQRRHELRAVLKNYSFFHLLRVLPQAMLLALGEIIVSLLAGDTTRARAVAGAYAWNLRRLGQLHRRRRAVQKKRVFPDSEVRRLQLRGSARLSTYLSRVAHQGFGVAHGRARAQTDNDEPFPGFDDEPQLTGSVGLAFSEDADFDELDDLGKRSGRDRYGRRRRRPVLSSGRSRAVAWVVVALVLAFGTRDLFAGQLPLIGQFAPLQAWGTTWHHFVSGWQPAGVGTTAPATPAFGALGIVGTVLFGGMGLTQKVLVLGCIPLGAWGVFRLLRPLATPRGRLVGTVSYLGLALPYDALARGRWDGLVAYAALPFIVSRLAAATGTGPYAPARRAEGEGTTGGTAATTDAHRSWRQALAGQILVLGIIESVAVSFAPAVAVDVLVVAAAIVVGSLVLGERRGSGRVLTVAVGSTLATVVLCGPWVVGTLAAGWRAVGVFGLAGAPSAAPSWGDVVRFATGPVGSSPLSWLLVAAALLPLLIGGSFRLAWAGRLWVVALSSWVLAFVTVRGWTGSFTPSIDVLLAPAAVAVAACIGLGLSSFEADLTGYQFGWRQLVSGLAVLAAVAGLVPVAVETMSGSWGLPSTGYAQPLSFLAPASATGSFRVLWLGDPRALPLGGWSVEPGLAYATSEDGTPTAAETFAPAGPGPSLDLARAVALAQDNETVHLGQLLAPAAVRYIVVLGTLAPSAPGVQSSPALPAPPGLVRALLDQQDLQTVPGGEGFTIFEDADYVPLRAERSGGPVTATGPWPAPGDLAGWHAVLSGPPGVHSYTGPLTPGTVLASYAPAGRWHLTNGGVVQPSTPAYGWAAQYTSVLAGPGALEIHTPLYVPVSVLAEVALWLLVGALLLGRARWLDWWWEPLRERDREARHRRTRRAAERGADAPGEGAAASEADTTAGAPR